MLKKIKKVACVSRSSHNHTLCLLRPSWHMPAACKWVHRMEYKSANTNLDGTGGIVQRALCSCPRITAFAVVSECLYCFLFHHNIIYDETVDMMMAIWAFYAQFTHMRCAWFLWFTELLFVAKPNVAYQHLTSVFCVLNIATRETSFVHAISAAGVMYTLTKNCSMGDFDNCGCDDSKIGQMGKSVKSCLHC